MTPPEKCPPDCDWPENRMYLQKSIENLHADMEKWSSRQEQRDSEIYKRLTGLQIGEAKLNVKSGAWGAIGALAVLLAAWFKDRLFHG